MEENKILLVLYGLSILSKVLTKKESFETHVEKEMLLTDMQQNQLFQNLFNSFGDSGKRPT